ncbi:hypothetical protein KKA15_02585 [Patescibacteria group bacterium]|nr:hypothetical protein [Patescibacteria group bacterium]
MNGKNLELQNQNENIKHAGWWGIASCLIFSAALLYYIFALIFNILSVFEAREEGQYYTAYAILFAIFFLLGWVISMIGTVVGFYGLCQSHRKKMFAVISTILNSLIFWGTIVLFYWASKFN